MFEDLIQIVRPASWTFSHGSPAPAGSVGVGGGGDGMLVIYK